MSGWSVFYCRWWFFVRYLPLHSTQLPEVSKNQPLLPSLHEGTQIIRDLINSLNPVNNSQNFYFFLRAPVPKDNGWSLLEIKVYPPAERVPARRKRTDVTFIGVANNTEDPVATSHKLAALADRECALWLAIFSRVLLVVCQIILGCGSGPIRITTR